jgi:hypothetical protein
LVLPRSDPGLEGGGVVTPVIGRAALELPRVSDSRRSRFSRESLVRGTSLTGSRCEASGASEQPLAVREGDGLCAAVDSQLREDVLDVRRDSLRADEQPFRDPFFPETFR